MAGVFVRSRNSTRRLMTKIGMLENLRPVFWNSSLPHFPIPPPITPIRAPDRNPVAVSGNPITPFGVRRFASISAGEELVTQQHDEAENQFLDCPGGHVPLTAEMKFMESPKTRAPCYRVLDENGLPIARSKFQKVSKEVALKMYNDMVTLQVMDTIFYEAQRQGRISFYLTSTGEEAINVASAAALTMDDIVFPQVEEIRNLVTVGISGAYIFTCGQLMYMQYREPGVLLWRGFTLQEFANQCFSNKADYGKGRQMPIHYGCNRLNYVTVSSPIATQIPHAAGAAYSLKMDQKNACTVAYFGDGGTSEGDFHAGINFAAVMGAPVIFFCRNNGWAISTSTSEQFRSDGIAVRGPAYGVQSIRVDGNDALAIFNAVQAAREIAIAESKPILVEAMTYRAGHHSTSDDSTKYRPVKEIEHWRQKHDPVARFRQWIQSNGWWNDTTESQFRNSVRNQLLNAIQNAEKAEKPPVTDLFTDVYDNVPSNLREQERWLRETIMKHPKDYPHDVPV
ncbi:hypothetical protein ACLOJK_016782 [Asimina triloba]